MIRRATTQDAKKLYGLENSIFKKDDFGLSLSSFYYHIKNNELYIYIKDEKIVGYILWLRRKKYFRLYSLCVDANYRGQNIAKKLLKFSFENLKAEYFSLEVKVTNTDAIKLYEKFDFKIKKILPKYYPKYIDGYLMIRDTLHCEDALKTCHMLR